MSENTEDYEEDDSTWNPGPALVGVNDLVAEAGHEEGGNGNNEDSSPSRHVRVDSIEELGSNNRVDG